MDLRFLRTHLSNVDLLRLRQMEEACLASLTSHVTSHVSLTLNISTCHTWIRTGKKRIFWGGVKKSCPLITAPIPLSICSSSQFDKHFLLLTHTHFSTHFSHMSHPICPIYHRHVSSSELPLDFRLACSQRGLGYGCWHEACFLQGGPPLPAAHAQGGGSSLVERQVSLTHTSFSPTAATPHFVSSRENSHRFLLVQSVSLAFSSTSMIHSSRVSGAALTPCFKCSLLRLNEPRSSK